MMHIASMLTSLEGGGRSFVGLLLLFVPRPGAASTAWDLKSVVANLGKEAASQSDVFHSSKCRSTEWTNLNVMLIPHPEKILTEDKPLL